MNCVKCGAKLLDTASFCTTCGTPVPKVQPKPAEIPNSYQGMFDFAAGQCLEYGQKARVGPVNNSDMGYGAGLLENLTHDFVVHDIPVQKAGFIKEVYVYHLTRKLYIHLIDRWYEADTEKKVDVLWSDLEKYCSGGLEGLFADVRKGPVDVSLIDHQSIPYVQKFPGMVEYLGDIIVANLVFYLVSCEHVDYNADYDRLCRLLGEKTVTDTIKALEDGGFLKTKHDE